MGGHDQKGVRFELTSTSVLLLASGTTLFGVALGAVATVLERLRPSPHRYGRKAIHLGIFSGAALVLLHFGFWAVIFFGSILSVLLALAWLLNPEAGPFAALRRMEGRDALTQDVLIPYAATVIGGFLSALLVGELAAVGYLVCGWGDPAGAWIGRRWGRRALASPFRSQTDGKKSAEGVAGVFGFGALGAVMILWLVGMPIHEALWVGSACGMAGATAEALAPSEQDNLWAQLLPSLTAWAILG